MLPISKAAQEAIDKLVAEYPDKWRGMVCAFGVFDRESGERIAGGVTGTVCHADLNYLNRAPKNRGICVDAHKHHHTNKEYALWANREAPFTNAVLNKDDEQQILRQAAVIDIEPIGHGGCLWLCKVNRRFTEDTFKLDYWNKLREQGLDGLQAFIGSDLLDQTGALQSHCTHVSLFGAKTPAEVRKDYDDARGWVRLDNAQVNRPGGYAREHNWGGLKHKTIKKPDGWGGFVEMKQPCDVKTYANILREIFEGDPKNVK